MALIEGMDKVLGRVALQVAGILKRDAPVISGRFKNSIVTEKIGNRWIVYSSLKYAEPLEVGLAPHVIRPKNKKALYWNGAKHPVKKVNHPGYPGKYMFLRASIKGKAILAEELRK